MPQSYSHICRGAQPVQYEGLHPRYSEIIEQGQEVWKSQAESKSEAFGGL